MFMSTNIITCIIIRRRPSSARVEIDEALAILPLRRRAASRSGIKADKQEPRDVLAGLASRGDALAAMMINRGAQVLKLAADHRRRSPLCRSGAAYSAVDVRQHHLAEETGEGLYALP